MPSFHLAGYTEIGRGATVRLDTTALCMQCWVKGDLMETKTKATKYGPRIALDPETLKRFKLWCIENDTNMSAWLAGQVKKLVGGNDEKI